jgi:hypothetical protein
MKRWFSLVAALQKAIANQDANKPDRYEEGKMHLR